METPSSQATLDTIRRTEAEFTLAKALTLRLAAKLASVAIHKVEDTAHDSQATLDQIAHACNRLQTLLQMYANALTTTHPHAVLIDHLKRLRPAGDQQCKAHPAETQEHSGATSTSSPISPQPPVPVQRALFSGTTRTRAH